MARHVEDMPFGMGQPDLFDQRNLLSLTHDDYPGERPVACRNPALAKLRAEKRKDLLAASCGTRAGHDDARTR